MRLTKPLFLVILAVALGAYAFDCGAATTPEQAMQCCHSMHCSSHGHQGMDCCKTMPTMHAPFVQSSCVHGISLSHSAFGLIPASAESYGLDSSASTVASQCHAPPGFCVPSPPPLRI